MTEEQEEAEAGRSSDSEEATGCAPDNAYEEEERLREQREKDSKRRALAVSLCCTG